MSKQPLPGWTNLQSVGMNSTKQVRSSPERISRRPAPVSNKGRPNVASTEGQTECTISYLDARASNAVLSGEEETSINIVRIQTIKSRLSSYFGTGLSEQFRFGSSTRGTNLPRSMDEDSDIDYMVVFSEAGYTPQTYLDRLKRFAREVLR